ncbi:MAG: hypothetical protein HZB26_25390 [Candidatus Hydrogenedentes bacterium]|nr:hypothetical protein [Candidatus Hydrogenedentota bacterium]
MAVYVGWWQVYPEYLTDMQVGQCPSAGRTSLYSQTDWSSARNIMAGCDASVVDFATLNNETDNPCFGKTAAPTSGPLNIAPNSPPARFYNGCDVTPQMCAPYPHTDLVKLGYTDMRAYRYYGATTISPTWMNNTLEDYYYVGCLAVKGNLNLQVVPNPGSVLTTIPWSNRNAAVTVTLPSGKQVTAQRTREGIERFMITDINNPSGSASAQSGIVMMLDESRAYDGTTGGGVGSGGRFNHVPGGANILYMDGHVEFAKFGNAGGNQWPMGQFAFKKPAGAWGNLDFF